MAHGKTLYMQWSLDLLEEWALMGPKGAVREEAGRVLSEFVKVRM